MTGPAELEFSGSFDPATGAWARDTRKRRLMGVDVVTFGCRLNTYESEVMRREAERRRPRRAEGRRGHLQHLRGDRRGGAPGRQAIRKARRENPDARIIVTGCAAQTEPASFAAMAEVDLVLGNEEKLTAHTYRALPDFGVNDSEKARVNDIMRVRETAVAHGRRDRGPRARLRAGAERLRPPLHLLHHPLRPRQFALGADGRGGRAGAAAGRQRLSPRSC